jgi:prepilin-type processing-associated H-X9-DG protein
VTKRRAFTLLELVVCFSILALVASLLLPAVQYAREAARRTDCQSRLRQVTFGMLNRESATGLIPPAYHGPKEGGSSLKAGSMIGHLGSIASQLGDSQAEFFAGQVENDDESWWNSESRQLLRSAQLPTLSCPSDGEEGGRFLIVVLASYYETYQNTLLRHEPSDCRTNYLGCAGSSPFSWANAKGRGVFQPGRSTRLRDVLDGTAQTIFFGEVTGEYFSPRKRIGRESSFSWLCGAVTTEHGINKDQYGEDQDSGVVQFRSRHAGGVNVSFVDGHTQFLSEQIDFPTLYALSTLADRDPVTTEYE